MAQLTSVPAANPKSPGVTQPNVLSPELAEVVCASGAMRLENPESPAIFYGYNDDQPNLVPLAGGSSVEAHKTEPDKNTYLVLRHQKGADPHYDYGTHFLFQGHESGPGTFPNQQGYVTRINLDADVGHRVTLLASKDVEGKPLPVFDGSTWYPWAQRLLLTAELGNLGGVWQATLEVPSRVEDISGVFGRAGYEGIQADAQGNLWLVEDTGGRTGTVNKQARQPNSFDLARGGKLQVLAVSSLNHPGTIVFNSADADTDITSQDIKDLHTYGKRFETEWITIHDTAVDGTTPFDANALAKGVGTPFKRPENGVFRPGTSFREFFFTDDDRGDTLHGQHNALDSAWLFDARADYSIPTHVPIRILAQGRDASATIDSGLLGSTGFTNEGDNEITGIHVSDGDSGIDGILGAKTPRPFNGAWRVFYTQQHGDNNTFEIIPNPSVTEPIHGRDWDDD
jgi:hypothetical protein